MHIILLLIILRIIPPTRGSCRLPHLLEGQAVLRGRPRTPLLTQHNIMYSTMCLHILITICYDISYYNHIYHIIYYPSTIILRGRPRAPRAN